MELCRCPNGWTNFRCRLADRNEWNLLCATNHLDYSVEAYSNTHRYLNTDENRYIEGDYTAENAYGGFIGTMEAFLAMIETGKTPVEREETIRNFSLIEKIMEG